MTADEPRATRDFDATMQLHGGRHWVEFDAERAGTGTMQAELRENHFGATLWGALDPAARSFIATAEHLYRLHRSDAGFDFSAVVLDLAKTVEVQTNLLLRQALGSAPRDVRLANVEGKTVDLATDGLFTLGELAQAIGKDHARAAHLRLQLRNGSWFVGSLPAILDELRDVRNAAAHAASIDRERVASLRARLIGVGCTGWLIELAKVHLPVHN